MGILSAQKIIDKNAEEYMHLLCEEQCAELDGLFDKVAQSVDILAVNAKEQLESPELLSDDEYREQYTARMRKMIATTANHTDGAMSAYLRYNPDFTPPTSGIFLEKKSPLRGLETQTPTDLSLYEEDDVEHVGWYYIPVEAGVPVWMEPYHNKNIDVYMISYVVPLKQDGVTIGIIGMDIDFSYITEKVAELKAYDTGYAYLENARGEIVYHPFQSTGVSAETQRNSVLVKQPLQNGMFLVLTAPYAEINKERNQLIVNILIFMVVLLAVFVVYTYLFAKSLTLPILELNKATKEIAKGNLDVQIQIDSRDEIGELAESFEATVEHLKRYTEYINGLAYEDALTHVKNKAAYDLAVKNLQMEIEVGKNPAFGIAVFDVNELKPVNDSLGHEYGNMLLTNSCQLLCKVFSHSPVFRIGGDEFVVILRGQDYMTREERFAQLERSMEATWKNTRVEERISIAAGMEIFVPGADTSVVGVFKRADAAMYENKRRMKEKRKLS